MRKKIINISKIITFNNTSNIMQIIENNDILIENEKIIEISNNLEDCDNIIDANNCIITPGL